MSIPGFIMALAACGHYSKVPESRRFKARLLSISKDGTLAGGVRELYRMPEKEKENGEGFLRKLFGWRRKR